MLANAQSAANKYQNSAWKLKSTLTKPNQRRPFYYRNQALGFAGVFEQLGTIQTSPSPCPSRSILVVHGGDLPWSRPVQ